jgi:dTDP-4-amino-4,6-dideoxygalactose transaminase
VKNGTRSQLQQHLKKNGVSTGVHYPIALPALSAYSYLNYRDGDFPEAISASREILSLPMFPELSQKKIEFISENIREFSRLPK